MKRIEIWKVTAMLSQEGNIIRWAGSEDEADKIIWNLPYEKTGDHVLSTEKERIVLKPDKGNIISLLKFSTPNTDNG